MFSKILLPTDGSRHSAEAARIAADIAAHHKGVVQPLVAVEYTYVNSGDLADDVARAIHHRIEVRAQAALERAADVIREAGGHAAEGKIVEGAPVEAILREAEDGEYGLIVMGSRGLNLEEGQASHIGSVTERVLHRSPCPVLVIRAEPRP